MNNKKKTKLLTKINKIKFLKEGKLIQAVKIIKLKRMNKKKNKF